MMQEVDLQQIRSHLSAMGALSPEQIERLMLSARKSVTRLLGKCLEDLVTGYNEDLDIAAHTLKGTLLQCGLPFWAERAQEICVAARHGDCEKVAQRLCTLQDGLKNIVLDDQLLEAQNSSSLLVPGDVSAHENVISGKNGQNPAVLFIEDDEILQNVVQGMLEYLEYPCDIADSGEEGFALYTSALAEKRSYGVVITDLRLQLGVDGLEMIRRFRMLDPDIPIVVSSGDIPENVQQKKREYGINEILLKPYTIEELSATLSRIFHKQATL